MSNPYLVNGVGSPQSIWQTSTVKHHKVGTRGAMNDGRVYYYSDIAAAQTTLLRANVHVAAVNVAAHQNVTQSTSGATLLAGATNVTVDIGAGAVVADQYVDGFLNMTDANGEGFDYKIKNHGLSAGSATLTLELYDPIVTAGTTSSVISMMPNAYHNPIIAAANRWIVGVTKVGVVAHATLPTYFWMQTWGPCSVLSGVAIPIGGGGIQSATAGCLTTGGAVTDVTVASGLILTVSTQHHMVDLRIRP